MTQPQTTSDFRGPPGPAPDISHLVVSCVTTKTPYCRLPAEKRGIEFGTERMKMYENATRDTFFIETPVATTMGIRTGTLENRRAVAQWTPNQGFTNLRKDGRQTQFDDDTNGANQIRGKTKIDGSLLLNAKLVNLANGWSIDTRDGHFRLRYNGDQKFVMHQDGKGWQASGGWFCSKAHNWLKNQTPYYC